MSHSVTIAKTVESANDEKAEQYAVKIYYKRHREVKTNNCSNINKGAKNGNNNPWLLVLLVIIIMFIPDIEKNKFFLYFLKIKLMIFIKIYLVIIIFLYYILK